MDIKLFGFKTEQDCVEINAKLHFDRMCIFNNYAKKGLIFKNRFFHNFYGIFYFFMEFYFL